MKLSLKSKIRQSDKVVSHKFEGTVYILDPQKNTIRALNDTAGFIWNSIDKRRSVASVITNLTDKFNVPQKRAYQDVLRYLSKLIRLGYVSVS